MSQTFTATMGRLLRRTLVRFVILLSTLEESSLNTNNLFNQPTRQFFKNGE
jgi:hypothetical protein